MVLRLMICAIMRDSLHAGVNIAVTDSKRIMDMIFRLLEINIFEVIPQIKICFIGEIMKTLYSEIG